MRREVGAQLQVEVFDPTTLEFQIAVAPHPGAEVTEDVVIHLERQRSRAHGDSGQHGTRIHKFDAGKGTVLANYSATIIGQAEPAPVTEIDLSTYLRPSRYAEADKFYGFAATEFGKLRSRRRCWRRCPSWVGTRLQYVPGSSDPIDGAADTLLAGRGVPRLRASGRSRCCARSTCLRASSRCTHRAAIRWTSTPSPRPRSTGMWRVVDATCLAPRQSMVRIATGRDAADTAFLDNHSGAINLTSMNVTAWVEGMLPFDSVEDLVSLGVETASRSYGRCVTIV